MAGVSDNDLLHEFARNRSEEAFTALAQRYLPLVRAAARRQVRDEHTAEDLAQAVFLVLAKKARHLKAPLAGWLIKTTHFCALDAKKLQRRREFHERRAAAMRSESAPAPTHHDPAAFVDSALAGLGQTDRNALTLHFLQQEPIRAVAALLDLTPDAARKRIERALRKLQHRLQGKTGITASAMSLPAAFAATAPAEISRAAAAEFARTALHAGAHPGASAVPALISKGAIHMMNLAKLKIVAGLAFAALAAGSLSYGILRPAFAQNAAAPVAAVPPAPASAPATTASATADNPLGIQIVAVGPYDPENHGWWSPAGEKMNFQRPANFQWVENPAGPGKKLYELAVRGSPSATAFGDLHWTNIYSDYFTSGWSFISVAVPLGTTSTSLRVEFAEGPWRTITSIPVTAGLGVPLWTQSLPGAHMIALAGPLQDGNDLHFVVADDLAQGASVPRRYVAIGKDRSETTSFSSMVNGKAFSQSLANFNKLKASNVASVRCDARPYDTWLQFDNLSLDGKPTKPGISTGTIPVPAALAALEVANNTTNPQPAPPPPSAGGELP